MSSNHPRKKPILFEIRASNWYMLATVSYSLFANLFIYTIIVPIMPFVLDGMEHGIGPSSFREGDYGDVHNSGGTSKETGILLAMFAATVVVGSAVFGYMGDRMPYRKYPMILGVLALFGSTFLFLYVTQVWMFVIARCFQGLSDSCIWTLGISLIVESFPADVLGAQQTIGIASGAPIGGAMLISHHIFYASQSPPSTLFFVFSWSNGEAIRRNGLECPQVQAPVIR